MRTSIVGDGCRYCNPQHYIDMLEEQVKEADIDPLMEKMAEALKKAIELIDRHNIPVGFKGNIIYTALQEWEATCHHKTNATA